MLQLVPFFILSSNITSILHQVCVESPIFHPVHQYHLNTASSLRCKSHFSSCPAASPQYCIKFVLQVSFSILPRSITSILHQDRVTSPIFHPVYQYHFNTASSLCCKFHFPSCPAASPQYCIKFVFQVQIFIVFSSIILLSTFTL